jgi:hypothetical protein
VLTWGATDAAAGLVKARVVSQHPNPCPGQAARVPLANAPFLLTRRGAEPKRGRLDAKGSLRTKIDGRGPAKLTIILADQRVRVVPPNDLDATPPVVDPKPYRFTYRYEGGGGRKFVILAGHQDAGAASVWTWLDRGAAVAAKALPTGVRLQRVDAIFKNGYEPGGLDDIESSAYDHGNREILVGSRGRADQFEPWVLLHEYGHHLRYHFGDLGPSSRGPHDHNAAYPDQPALPFSEGFSHAFAAIVIGDPSLKLRCRVDVDLSTTPVTPEPPDRRYAQYNELSVAGVFWGLARRLANGNRQTGLARILTALKIYRRAGQPVGHMRDLRDALIEAGLEPTAGRHLALSAVFAGQRMSWGMKVFACPGCDPEEEGGTGLERERAWVILRGPYGECAGTGDNPIFGARGALGYTSADDCLVSGGTVPNETSLGLGEAAVAFPYLANNAHRDSHVFSVGWSCDIDECPASRLIELDIYNGDCVGDSLEACGQNGENLLEGRVFRASVTVMRGQEVEAVRFDGAGGCTVIPTGEDCGV